MKVGTHSATLHGNLRGPYSTLRRSQECTEFSHLAQAVCRIAALARLTPSLKSLAKTRAQGFTWRARGLSKSFLSGVIIGVTPVRVLITLLKTYILSPLPLQVDPKP